MALGTLDIVVLAQQREFGFLVMIERDLFPAALHVAGFALGSELALVLVILLVA